MIWKINITHSSLHILNSTDSPLVQFYITTLYYSFILQLYIQLYITALYYSFILQLYITTLYYNFILQLYIIALYYNFKIQLYNSTFVQKLNAKRAKLDYNQKKRLEEKHEILNKNNNNFT